MQIAMFSSSMTIAALFLHGASRSLAMGPPDGLPTVFKLRPSPASDLAASLARRCRANSSSVCKNLGGTSQAPSFDEIRIDQAQRLD
jgi:hypothetical protein